VQVVAQPPGQPQQHIIEQEKLVCTAQQTESEAVCTAQQTDSEAVCTAQQTESEAYCKAERRRHLVAIQVAYNGPVLPPSRCVFITAVPITKLFAWGGGGGTMEDMCYESLRAEACVD
jgi:hypothetical protein